MIISDVFIGRMNNGDFDITQINLNDDQLNMLSESVKIRNKDLPKLQDSLENLNSTSRNFSVKTGDGNSSYHLDLLIDIYNKIYSSDAKMRQLIRIDDLNNLDEDDKLIYKYVIYFGYRNKKEEEEKTKASVGAIFRFKNNFVFQQSKFFIFFKQVATSNLPKLDAVYGDEAMQLPVNDNIATFFAKEPGLNLPEIFKLNVYKPNEFDYVFNTQVFKKKYALKTFDMFLNSKNKLCLTKNEIPVSFLSYDLSKIDINGVKNRIFQDRKLIDALSTFTGNANSTIQKIDFKTLSKVIDKLKKYVESDADCRFILENIPVLKDNKILVNTESVPIFCSILKNEIIEKLLSNKIHIPYYDED